MTIDPEQPIPLFFQLKTHLLEAMLRGEYGPGERLPTEHELCRRHGLSRTPVSRALSELAEEGVILRHRRRGSFVNPHWVPRRPTELRAVVPAEGPWENLIRAAATDDPSINVVAVPRAELHRTLTQAVAEGLAPDIAVLDSVWIPEFAAAGFLHALDDIDERWIRSDIEDDVLPPLLSANRYLGRTYSISLSADVAGLWYRREDFHALNLDPPATWEELRTAGRRLRSSRGHYPLAWPGGTKGSETTTYCLLAFLASNGVEVLDDDRVLIDQPRTVQSLRFVRQLIEDDLVPVEAVGYEWNQPIRLLARGRVSMSLGGSYEGRTLAEAMHLPVEKLVQHAGFLPIPSGPQGSPGSVAGTMVCGIMRQAASPERAMRLLRAISQPANLATVALTGRIPPRRSAIKLAGSDLPLLEITASMLETATIRPATPLYSRVSVQLQTMLEAVLTGRHAPDEAASRTAELIAAITGLSISGPSPSL